MESDSPGICENRIFVKIMHNHENKYKALAKVVYHRNEMTVPFYARWSWYFEYRAALLRIKYPKAYTELIHGTHQYIPKAEELRKKQYDKIISKKAKITQVKNRIKRAEAEWRELWHIEENQQYQEAIKKLFELEEELCILTQEFNNNT
jgi:hypothetical protein